MLLGIIRTMSDEQGEPLFCGKDVARALGYKKPENAVAMHVDRDDTLKQGVMIRLAENSSPLLSTNRASTPSSYLPSY